MTTNVERPTSYDADDQGWFGGPGRLRRPVHARGADRRARRADRRLAGRDGRPGVRRRVRRDPARVRRHCRARSTTPSGSRERSGARILLKREDLNHTGAHKIRNVLGQALLTKRMGKTRVIAETGAGQHGVASATAAAYFGLDCTVYMGAVDTARQALNVARMHLLGAKVVAGRVRQRARSRTPSTRRCATGSPASTTRRTSSAPRPARTRSPAWSATSPAASATRPRRSASTCTGGCPTRSPPASAAAPTRSACSPRSSTTPTVRDLRLRGRAATGVDTAAARRHDPRRRPRGPARRPHLRAPGRGRPDHRVALDLRRARLPRGRAPARPPRGDRPRDVPPGDRRRGDGGVGAAQPAPRGSSRPSSRRTRSPARCGSRSGWPPRRGPRPP